MSPLWQRCVSRLESEVSENQLNTWIRPLHAIEDGEALRLLAPNRFVLDWVRDHFFDRIDATLRDLADNEGLRVSLEVGSGHQPGAVALRNSVPSEEPRPAVGTARFTNNLNPNFT
ncbi:MAG: DnaA N-terminal domain-containing protein, partial [Chromatiales bacterium]